MDELIERLRAALAPAYDVERPLGEGGMALVFLAHDRKHQRAVAVKLLRPELAAAMGPDRFLREIEIAARLQHPHILPLYDSGEADGLLYYIMPYVEGESLRERLDREKQLSLGHAVEIARQVASALAYAHSRDLVHRDIKPENILLTGGEVVLADFGIARAITAAGGDRLTQTGLAVGTPSYMSPEQSAGGEVDGRSDVYALGCVLFEMLAGRPPFTGPTVGSVVQQHLTADAPAVTQLRGAVSATVAAAVARALAKTPADRFATAQQFAEALTGAPPVPSANSRATGRRRVLAGVALAAVLAVAVFWLVRRPGTSATVDRNLVVVVPFRVTTTDPSLSYLREGMVDLLAAKLTGEGGPRASDPRTAIGAWRRAGGSEANDLAEPAALALAQRLGGGLLLLGGIVGTAEQLQLNASLLAVPGGRVRARAELRGAADSIPVLVDRLAAELLAAGAGESERLAQLTSTSLPALRTYLDGQAAYRRGHYAEAGDRFAQAVALDSSFALAGIGLVAARYWTRGGFDATGVAVAWAHRERLSARDRALVVALAGSRYPEQGGAAEQLTAFDRAVGLAPDRAEPWYWLAETYYHLGPLVGLADARERAREAFARAAGLDSMFSAPVLHLLDMAAEAGDSSGARRYLRWFLEVDSASDLRGFAEWEAAAWLGDAADRAAVVARFDGMSTPALRAIVGVSVMTGRGLTDGDSAAAILARRPAPPAERLTSLLRIHDAALARGHLARAARYADAAREIALGPALAGSIYDALLAGGDSARAGHAFAELAPQVDATVAGRPGSAVGRYAVCAVALWRAAQQLPTSSQPLAAWLARPPATDEPSPDVSTGQVCTATLAALRGAPGALEQLDSLMRAGPIAHYQAAAAANFTVARLFEERGEYARALAAARREVYHFGTYRARRLMTVGRLAALAGEPAAAVLAYEAYLALRPDPDPALRPEVAQVRAELTRLIAARS